MQWYKNLICFHKFSLDIGPTVSSYFAAQIMAYLSNPTGMVIFLFAEWIPHFFPFPSDLHIKSHFLWFLFEGPIHNTQSTFAMPNGDFVSYIIICNFCIAAHSSSQMNSTNNTVFISGSSKSILEKKKLSWHSSLIQWWRLTWQIIPAMWKTEMDGNMPVFCCVKRVFVFVAITMVCLDTK